MIAYRPSPPYLLALVPIVGIAVFGTVLVLKAKPIWRHRNVSGADTFEGDSKHVERHAMVIHRVKSALRLRTVWSKPETQRAYRHHRRGTDRRRRRILTLQRRLWGLIPNAALRVSASPFGSAARMAGRYRRGYCFLLCGSGFARFLSAAGRCLPVKPQKRRRTMVSSHRSSRGVSKAGTPSGWVAYRPGVLMTIFQFNGMSPNAAKRVWSGLLRVGYLHHGALSLHLCRAVTVGPRSLW